MNVYLLKIVLILLQKGCQSGMIILFWQHWASSTRLSSKTLQCFVLVWAEKLQRLRGYLENVFLSRSRFSIVVFSFPWVWWYLANLVINPLSLVSVLLTPVFSTTYMQMVRSRIHSRNVNKLTARKCPMLTSPVLWFLCISKMLSSKVSVVCGAISLE